jgi:Fe-S-cluster containining protein
MARNTKRRRRRKRPQRPRLRDRPSDESVDLMREVAKAEYRAVREILAEGRNLDKVSELARNSQSFATGMIAKINASLQPPLSCKAGCSCCCHLSVTTTIPEVLYVADLLNSRGYENFAGGESGKSSVSECAARLQGVSFTDRLRTRCPCPLLNQSSGHCTVYERRPLACRGWNSADVRNCEQGLHRPEDGPRVPVFAYQLDITRGITAGLVAGLKDAGWSPTAVNLTDALHIALTRPSAAERWLRGETIFDSASVGDEAAESFTTTDLVEVKQD